jgi:IclR family transcriptional regulator, KDG regulon repressor
LISSKELKGNLKQVAAQGYAVDDQEREEGVRCVAAPVRDHTGEVIAGISIAGPSIRVTKERIARLAGHVVRAADEISAAIGYRVMPNGADKATIRKISGHGAKLNGGLR